MRRRREPLMKTGMPRQVNSADSCGSSRSHNPGAAEGIGQAEANGCLDSRSGHSGEPNVSRCEQVHKSSSKNVKETLASHRKSLNTRR